MASASGYQLSGCHGVQLTWVQSWQSWRRALCTTLCYQAETTRPL